MEKLKLCSGCKENKKIDEFYKNKRMEDGRSNYCISCTKENSQKYYQRKKEKESNEKTDDLMKMLLLSEYREKIDPNNADILVKVLMLKKLVKSVLEEIEKIEETITKNEEVFEE
jgi:hypothetical protein